MCKRAGESAPLGAGIAVPVYTVFNFIAILNGLRVYNKMIWVLPPFVPDSGPLQCGNEGLTLCRNARQEAESYLLRRRYSYSCR